MPDETNIERVHKIDGVHIASPLDLDSDLANKTAKSANKSKVYYAAEKDSGLERVFDEVKNIVNGGLDTIAGKNKAGKDLAKVKDLLALLFPVLEPGDEITDEIGDMIKSKRTKKTIMSNQAETLAAKIKRFIKQPSTQAGVSFVLMVVGGIWSGVHIDAATLTSSVVGIVTALAGVYTAVTNLINIFRDEAKSA